MIPATCPCCEAQQPPHKSDCTFHADAPDEAADFDDVSLLRSEIDRLREARRWVSVGERLPEEDLQVLVWGKGWSSPAIGWRKHRPHYIIPVIPETIWTLGDKIDRGYPPQDITFWHPLPPGPEGPEGDA